MRWKTYTVPMVLELLRRLRLGRPVLSPALQELPSDTCCVGFRREDFGRSGVLEELECENE